jgi:hypothetical protein
MKRLITGIVFALTAHAFVGQTAPAFSRQVSQHVSPQVSPQLPAQPSAHAPLGIISDWTHRHVLYPDSKNDSALARIHAVDQTDPRWLQNWYLRHPEAWWPQHRRGGGKGRHRDWSVPLSATPLTSAFEPLIDFAFTIGPNTAYGSLNTTDNGNGSFQATAGTLTVTGGQDVGSYPLYPGGPGQTTSPDGFFLYDNLFYPSTNPLLDNNGPLFIGNGLEINIFSNLVSEPPPVYNYQYYDDTGYNDTALGQPVTLSVAPGGGQTTPAKFVFDVNAVPSCSNDFVAIGIPASPAAGGQANIVGYNNLYSYQGTTTQTPLCPTDGPTVMFAYASGTGQVPASVVLSQNGSQLAYIENLPTGSSYFHVLTLGTTGTNGSSPSAAVVPGSAGGNNAVDQTVLLSPDGGITNQSSTNTVWVVYTHGDANDVAYATTYSAAGTGSGYLYKISNVFNGSAPTIVWSVPITAVPSTPVFDFVSNNIFFTDSNGSIDYVTDLGGSPSTVTYTPIASGNTAENPVVIDSIHEMVYATFNSNGTNALVVQAPTSMASNVSASVGPASTIYTGPYEPDFNNAWYTGSGTPLLYIAGTGAGTVPTLYSVGFNGSGVMNSTANVTTAPLTTGMADSSPVTEFYNTTLLTDYLFVGVTDNCVAATEGGTAGCVMSLDITNGFPTVTTSTTALAAAGGTSAIIVDNDSSLTEASSIYYATKTGATLVKATQSGLN